MTEQHKYLTFSAPLRLCARNQLTNLGSTVYKMLDHAGRAVPYGRARENRASHMGKQRLSHGVTTIGFCYGTSGTLGTEGTDATGIPRPKAVREADALAGVRVPPAWRYEATTDATRREGHAPAWPSEGDGRAGARPSLRWGFILPTLGVRPPYVGGSASLH